MRTEKTNKPQRHRGIHFVVLGVLCASVASYVNVTAAGQPCDRACLRTTLDAYLNAVVKHDPAAAPLMIGFRQTENAIVVRPGTGLWKTMTAVGAGRRYLDPVTGQAAFFGVIEEGAEKAVVTVRLKIDDRKVSEAEWTMARKGEWGPNGPGGNLFNPDGLAANLPPERVVPKAQRLSRESLIAITNSYFDALTTHDGEVMTHESGCTRVENGTGMTNRPGRNGGPPSGDCASGLTNFNASIVAARRYPLVDEDAQAVLALAVFLRKPGSPTRRNMFSEWFFIDNQKIHLVYSAMFYPPSDQPVPNWPPYDGNFPLPASLAPAAPAQNP